MDHRHLERLFERAPQGRGPGATLVGRVAHDDQRPRHRRVGLERLENGRPAGESAVDQERALDVDRGKRAGDRARGHEGVDAHRPVVEAPRLPPDEIGRGDE